MPRYALSRRAKSDLADIWSYTASRWSEDQADRYLRLIQSAIEAAAERPDRGRNCDDIREGYFRLPVGSHLLFYRTQAGGIAVMRILHQRMDFERHL